VSSLVAYHEGQGTRDLSAFLSVPAAIAFQAEHDWDSQRRRCHALASATRRRLNAFTGLDSLCPDSEQWFSQMVSIRIPGGAPGQEGAPALVELRNRLYQDYHIEMPVMNWRGQGLIRVSLQAYNDESDVDTLIEALERWLPQAAQPAR
jgi:isopenicillin-N epimerase